MSEEKRQTRLLPFRLRRTGAARRVGRDGFDGADDFSADAELTALLRAWEAPPAPHGARERLLADFRTTVGPAPLWRRALSSQVRVPLPVAACAALALLASLFALGARTRATRPAAGAESLPAVRVVEVPVVQERVVTRTVYVEKKERTNARAVARRRAGREELADGGAAAVSPGEDSRKPAEPAPAPEARGGYFTRVDMEDFQPADEVKFRIVKRGSSDEK